MTDKGTNFYASVSNGGIRLMFWTHGQTDGLTSSMNLCEKDARRLAAEILGAIDKLPRVACAADFGLEEAA